MGIVSAVADFFADNHPTIAAMDYTGSVILGPVMSESESYSANVSSHAIEDGSRVEDHVYSAPETFAVKTVLVDDSSILGKLAGAAMSAVGLGGGGSKTVKDKLSLLKEWKSKGKLLKYSGPVFSAKSIIGSLLDTDGYDVLAEDVVITKLDISRDNSVGNGVSVSLSFQKIRIAKAKMGDVNLPNAAQATSNAGMQSTGSDATSGGASLLSQTVGH